MLKQFRLEINNMLLNILIVFFILIEFLIASYLIKHSAKTFLGFQLSIHHSKQLKKFGFFFIILGILTLFSLFITNTILIALMLIIGMITSSLLLISLASLFKG